MDDDAGKWCSGCPLATGQRAESHRPIWQVQPTWCVTERVGHSPGRVGPFRASSWNAFCHCSICVSAAVSWPFLQFYLQYPLCRRRLG